MRILDFADGFTSSVAPTAVAYPASSISVTPSGSLSSDNAQDALEELQADIDNRATESDLDIVANALVAHINDASDAHDASAISNVPTGNLAATNVQTALDELQTDVDGRVSKSLAVAKGDILVASAAGVVGALTVGANGYVPVADSSQPFGILWSAPAATTASVSAKTSTYAILSTDDVLTGDVSGGAFTMTLPTAVGAAGKRYYIKRLDQTLGTALTIATTSSQTIDGVTTTTLDTQYESIALVSDGANWIILDRKIPSVVNSYTPSITYSSGGMTNATHSGKWKRIGDSIYIEILSAFTGASAAFSRPVYSLPSGLTIDSSKFGNGATIQSVGRSSCLDLGVNSYEGGCLTSTSSTFEPYVSGAAGTYTDFGIISNTTPFTFNNTDMIKIFITTPITGWKG